MLFLNSLRIWEEQRVQETSRQKTLPLTSFYFRKVSLEFRKRILPQATQTEPETLEMFLLSRKGVFKMG